MSPPPAQQQAGARDAAGRVEVYPVDAALPQDVCRFMDAHAAGNVELQHAWFLLLADNIPALARDARYLVLRDGAGCAAVWPVRVGDEAGALNSYFTSLYAPVHRPGVTAQMLAPLVQALRESAGHCGSYRFAPMDLAAPDLALLEGTLRLAGMHTSRYYRFGNWYLPTAGLRWSDYFASRSGELRNTVRRTTRRFQAQGGTLELITGGADLERGIAAYEAVYAASWKEHEPHQRFVSALARLCARQGWLRLGIAWLDGQPVAAQLWTVAFGRAAIFKLAYDARFARYSPGTLLTCMLLEHCIERDRVHEVDYLIGDDRYKADWMSQRRERWGLAAHDPRTLPGAVGALRQALTSAVHQWQRSRKPAPPGADRA